MALALLNVQRFLLGARRGGSVGAAKPELLRGDGHGHPPGLGIGKWIGLDARAEQDRKPHWMGKQPLVN